MIERCLFYSLVKEAFEGQEVGLFPMCRGDSLVKEAGEAEEVGLFPMFRRD